MSNTGRLLHRPGVMVFLLACCISVILWSCGQGHTVSCSESKTQRLSLAEVPFEALSEGFFAVRSMKEMGIFFLTHPALEVHFFERRRYATVRRLHTGLLSLVQDPHIDSLRQDVVSHYGDLSVLREELGVAWGSLQAYDADFVPPRLETLISGLYKDVYLSDSVMIVSLDYFIGPTARYKPQGMPAYLLRRHTPRHLVPTLLFYLASRYNKTDMSDRTLLADMIAMGKVYAFAKGMLPCTPDSVFLGYTPEEMQDIQENEHTIWAYFLYNQLLYEQGPGLKAKFIGERPKVFEISARCPGRIGHWLGWQIVRAYLQRQDQTGYPALSTLMEERDAKKILSLSRYSPVE